VITTIPVSFTAIEPELILLGTAAVLLVFAIFLPDEAARRLSAAATVVALLGATLYTASAFHDAARAPFDHTLRIDAFGQGARMLIFVTALAAVAYSWGMGHLRERSVEYHVLLLTATAGMSLLCVANSFVTAFVALELFSLALYVLVAFETDDLLSLEGGLKYLIIGSVGAAFLLYGAALTYGASGQLEFDRIRAGLALGDSHNVLVLMGLAMSPHMDSVLGWLVDLVGGRQSARTIHFIIAFGFIGFVLIHVFEVLISGVFNQLRSMITGRYRVPGGKDENHETAKQSAPAAAKETSHEAH